MAPPPSRSMRATHNGPTVSSATTGPWGLTSRIMTAYDLKRASVPRSATLTVCSPAPLEPDRSESCFGSRHPCPPRSGRGRFCGCIFSPIAAGTNLVDPGFYASSYSARYGGCWMTCYGTPAAGCEVHYNPNFRDSENFVFSDPPPRQIPADWDAKFPVSWSPLSTTPDRYWAPVVRPCTRTAVNRSAACGAARITDDAEL